MSSKSSKQKKGTGSTVTQSYPFTRGFQKTLEQFPNLAITSAEETASLQAASTMSDMPTSGMPLSFHDLQAPGPIPAQVPAPFSSLPADSLPASSSQAGSPFRYSRSTKVGEQTVGTKQSTFARRTTTEATKQ